MCWKEGGLQLCKTWKTRSVSEEWSAEDKAKRTLHGSDIGGLTVFLLFVLDLFLELVEGDLLVFNDNGDLEHSNTVTNGDELGGTL